MRPSLFWAALGVACLIGLIPLFLPKAQVPPKEHTEEVEPYSVRGRVLARKNYHFDALSRYVPTDLALAWGLLTAPENYHELTVEQGGRRFWWYASKELLNRLSHPEIEALCANTHIVPSSKEIAETAANLKPGDLIFLEGSLINLTLPDGTLAKTSTTRHDRGDGACEIVLVKRLVKLENP